MKASIDAQFLITTECMTVTSAMRKSSRWVNAGIAAILGAPSNSNVDSVFVEKALESAESGAAEKSTKGKSDAPEGAASLDGEDGASDASSPETLLILGFAAVRPELAAHGAGGFSTLEIVKPFLEVVMSPLVSGYITSLALTSLEKFFILGIIDERSQDITQCLDQTLHALAHCRFEATDRQEDDAVLLQLMSLVDKIVSGSCGSLLSERAVGEILDTCISMAKQMKRRDSLRRSVVAALMSLVRTVFPGEEPELRRAADRIFLTLVALLDPAKLQHTNSIRITVLSILRMCFEVRGSAVGDRKPQGEPMQQLWKYVAQLIRVTNSPRLVREALQLVITIQNVAPARYKNEFEFIIVYLLTSLTPLSDLPRDESTDDMFYAGVPNRARCVKSAPIEPGSNTLAIPTAALQKTPEIREVMVEALAALAVSNPTLFADLYVTYDCDRASPDLCEDLLGFLCRNAYPDSATWSTASVPPLCLEAVLSGISAWAESTDAGGALSPELKQRLAAKEGKALEVEVADTFNKSPSKGVADMKRLGIIKSDDPEEIARFLHSCKRLNKAVLGKYFAKSENKDVLAHYVKSFDFSGKRIDEALRVMLCSFRLPGESAQIENLLQKFADHYIESGSKVEKNSDSAFILAYAVLMLNTDHYSPTLKRRMDYDSFKRNVQGVDKDIPDEYVQAIFDGITSQEIVMPEEHDTDETFEISWRDNVLGNQGSLSGDMFYSRCRQREFVKAIFDTNWRPIVSTLSFVFATATDDLVFRRVISGFHQLAVLAAKFHSHQALTHIIACLSQISALSSGDLAFPNSNIEVRIENHISVMVSDLSTQFGGDLKAQMASITLFRILNVAAEEVSRGAYTLVCKALTNLHLYGLGTPSGVVDIEPIPPFHTFERSKAGKPVGIFSALSSYLTSSPDTPAEPSDESVDAALGASECIKACRIEDTILALIKGSPANFAQGALDAVPRRPPSDKAEQPKDHKERKKDAAAAAKLDQKYRPAREFLLRLAGRAADMLPELRQQICKKALEFDLTATALRVAPAAEAEDLMDQLHAVDADALDVLLRFPPSKSVWRLIGLVETPDTAVISYVSRNIAQVGPGSVEPVLACLRHANKKDESVVVQTVSALASRLRHQEHYDAVLAFLGAMSGNPNGAIRESALSRLQQELLADDQALSWAAAANDVLIPHVLELLLKPEVWKRDPAGMDMTRQQAASMTGKVFLHLTDAKDKAETEADVDAWIAVLKILDRLLSSRRQPALQDSVVEMLKNVIAVTRLASRGSPEFWARTESELKGFLPQVAAAISKELAPKEPPAAPQPDPHSESQGEAQPEAKSSAKSAPDDANEGASEGASEDASKGASKNGGSDAGSDAGKNASGDAASESSPSRNGVQQPETAPNAAK